MFQVFELQFPDRASTFGSGVYGPPDLRMIGRYCSYLLMDIFDLVGGELSSISGPSRCEEVPNSGRGIRTQAHPIACLLLPFQRGRDTAAARRSNPARVMFTYSCRFLFSSLTIILYFGLEDPIVTFTNLLSPFRVRKKCY